MRLRSNENAINLGGAVPIRANGDVDDINYIGHPLGLSPEQIAAVLMNQEKNGKLFGETALELGFVDEQTLNTVLNQHHAIYLLESDDTRVDRAVIMAFDPNDPLSTSARDIRMRLDNSFTAAGAQVKRVALLSLSSSAETSVLAANIAVACAQTGQRTLLIDANFLEPKQHLLFRLKNRTGTSRLLMSKGIDQNTTQATPIEGLAVMTSGPSISNPSELTAHKALALATESLIDSFDRVIADTGQASLLGVSSTLGFDAAVLVIRRDFTALAEVKDVVERLQGENVLVAGIVMVD